MSYNVYVSNTACWVLVRKEMSLLQLASYLQAVKRENVTLLIETNQYNDDIPDFKEL